MTNNVEKLFFKKKIFDDFLMCKFSRNIFAVIREKFRKWYTKISQSFIGVIYFNACIYVWDLVGKRKNVKKIVRQFFLGLFPPPLYWLKLQLNLKKIKVKMKQKRKKRRIPKLKVWSIKKKKKLMHQFVVVKAKTRFLVESNPNWYLDWHEL